MYNFFIFIQIEQGKHLSTILLILMSCQLPTVNKWQIFTMTFFAYAALHSMRMAYAQVKPQFKQAFHQSHLFLGLFDAAIYLSLGIGFLTRFYFSKKKNLIDTYFICMTIASLAYLYIPLSSLFFGDKVQESSLLKQILPGLSLLIFGFCQFPAWPTLLTIINQHFDVQKQGYVTGTWSSCGDIGNLMGLILSGILITLCHWRWEHMMIAASILNWTAAFLIYMKIDESSAPSKSPRVLQVQPEILPTLQERATLLTQSQQFWVFSKAILAKQQNKLHLLSMGLLKSILYGFLLWMPTYLTHHNFGYYKSTVPILFNLGSLIGSFILGYLYNNNSCDKSNNLSNLFNHLKCYALFYSCIGVTSILIIFYVFKITILVYFILSTFCGAFLGGCFNMLASNQVLTIVKGNKEDVNRLSTLTMAIGNLMVGLVEIVIGLAVTNDENMLFIILVAIGIISMLALLRRSSIMSKKQQNLALQKIQQRDLPTK